MLPNWLTMAFLFLVEAWSARRDARIRFLQLQVELLRQKLPGNRVILSPDDRRRLLRAGGEMDHRVHNVLGIVSVKTYKRWVREDAAGEEPGRVGRPWKITPSLRALTLRLARENTGWGVRRIVGELRKLALTPSRSSVRRVLVEEGVLPDPDRRAPKGVTTPWRTFIKMHINTMVACDFFCKSVWTPAGRQVAHCLMFIHFGSRKVFVSPSTFHPTGEWVAQQARNVGIWLAEQGLEMQHLVHDRDTKFTEAFDACVRSTGAAIVKTPFQSPMANSFAESWIGSMKRECLNHFACFGLRHLDHIVQTYADYYNTVRPHQGLGNRPLTFAADAPQQIDGEPPPEPLGPIRRKQLLGGLLNHYHREAA